MCEACGVECKPGDLVYADVDGGFLHAACMGYPADTDPEGFFDLETGEPCTVRPQPFTLEA